MWRFWQESIFAVLLRFLVFIQEQSCNILMLYGWTQASKKLPAVLWLKPAFLLILHWGCLCSILADTILLARERVQHCSYVTFELPLFGLICCCFATIGEGHRHNMKFTNCNEAAHWCFELIHCLYSFVHLWTSTAVLCWNLSWRSPGQCCGVGCSPCVFIGFFVILGFGSNLVAAFVPLFHLFVGYSCFCERLGWPGSSWQGHCNSGCIKGPLQWNFALVKLVLSG